MSKTAWIVVGIGAVAAIGGYYFLIYKKHGATNTTPPAK
jgi:hypothetical protein